MNTPSRKNKIVQNPLLWSLKTYVSRVGIIHQQTRKFYDNSVCVTRKVPPKVPISHTQSQPIRPHSEKVHLDDLKYQQTIPNRSQSGHTQKGPSWWPKVPISHTPIAAHPATLRKGPSWWPKVPTSHTQSQPTQPHSEKVHLDDLKYQQAIPNRSPSGHTQKRSILMT